MTSFPPQPPTSTDRVDARTLAALALGVVSPTTVVAARVAELRRVGDRSTAQAARKILALLRTTDPTSADQALAVLEVAFPVAGDPLRHTTHRPGPTPRRTRALDGREPRRARSALVPDEAPSSPRPRGPVTYP